MTIDKINILGLNESALLKEISSRYGKGLFHCRGLNTHLYSVGSFTGLEDSGYFSDNRELAQKITNDFTCALPPVSRVLEEDGTIKFTIQLADGHNVESVIIPMKNHTSLCVSSQVGCARGCVFCRTAKMGFIRNLSAAEIIAQYMTARFVFKKDIRNIVFMGMGEPFDNLDAVLAAVDILADDHAIGMPMRRISLSTCGHCQGLSRLKDRIGSEREKAYHLLTLSISLHSLDDKVRSALMPVNRLWPLDHLRATLLSMPHASDKDKIYFEYMVIPGINDSGEDAALLIAFLEGFRAKVNLIAYEAPDSVESAIQKFGANLLLRSASREDMDRFWGYLRVSGIACFTRISKGQRIQASCGQLATKSP